MKKGNPYLMESPHEAYRLHLKNDAEATRAQLRWCGIGPGARVLDVGCGSGAVTAIMHELAGPQGEVVGLDFSAERIAYAREHFGGRPGIRFVQGDFTAPLTALGEFDFIWVRFVLEYFRAEAAAIVAHLSGGLGPEGQLCLLDLDNNCLSHYALPPRMEKLLAELVAKVAAEFNFDPYAGRRLYSYLYDLNFRDVEMALVAHHLIYGELRSADAFNWTRKLEMAAEQVPEMFREYPGGYSAFFADFQQFSADPRRFTYTPLIMCKASKPSPLERGTRFEP